MYRAFFTILAVILVVSTVFMAVVTPKMHNSIFMYDSGLKIVMQENDTVKTEVIPTQVNTVKAKPAASQNIITHQETITPQTAKIVQTPLNVQTQQSVRTVTSAAKSKTVQKPVVSKLAPQPAATTTQPAQKSVSKPAAKPTPKPEPVKQQTVKPKPQQPVKTAAQIAKEEQEELVLWNKWRSDLQNRIMTDVKLPLVKQGTVFKFSFDVDKYGKISNISTWSTDTAYTPYAIQYIAPVIRSYQGRDFMNFPAGSNRVTTTVSGAWRISDKTTYSTPSDFKDVEKIRN